jgi:hypothetical protein
MACVEGYDTFSLEFEAELKSAIESVQQVYPGVRKIACLKEYVRIPCFILSSCVIC